jgi:hypothetical protein
VGNPSERGLPRRPKRRKEDNIKTALKFVIRVWTGFIWLRIASNAGHSGKVIDLLVPQIA